VSDTQVPASPHGNTVIGDYELRYQAEKAFHFKGGGLIVGFGSSPPGQYADAGCEQVGVSTTNEDASGRFYARFCFKPNLATEPLDVAGDCGGTGVELQGMILRTSGRVPPHN
jgi:hypothetical protein